MKHLSTAKKDKKTKTAYRQKRMKGVEQDMEKFAVAGYDRNRQKLAVKVLDLDGVVDLLKSYKHYGYEPEQLEKLKKDLVNPKGHYVDF